MHWLASLQPGQSLILLKDKFLMHGFAPVLSQPSQSFCDLEDVLCLPLATCSYPPLKLLEDFYQRERKYPKVCIY